MKQHTITGLALALFVFAGCQAGPSNTSATANINDIEPTTEAVPLIRVYTVDGRPTETHQAANQEVKDRLNQATTFKANKTDLRTALQHIRDATGVNLAVNWPALDAVGIKPESWLDVNLKDVAGEQMLELVLEQASVDAYDDDKADYVIRGEVVHISTIREMKNRTESRLYPLDWYANYRPSLNKRVYGRNNDARRMLGMTTLQNKTIDPATINVQDNNPAFCATCASSHDDRLDVTLSVMTYWEKIDQLVDLIQSTVGNPDEWLDEESTMTEITGVLLVKTTPENHDHIIQLFEAMRLDRVRQFKEQAQEMETLILLEAAENARLTQDYRAALRKINEALRVDPNSLEAQALKDVVTTTMNREP